MRKNQNSARSSLVTMLLIAVCLFAIFFLDKGQRHSESDIKVKGASVSTLIAKVSEIVAPYDIKFYVSDEVERLPTKLDYESKTSDLKKSLEEIYVLLLKNNIVVSKLSDGAFSVSVNKNIPAAEIKDISENEIEVFDAALRKRRN